ncbi:MAG: hypothetical protein MK042_15125 [Cognatishimia sp.]|nr:hypothetical protein [Cognatishimia sp.]
MSDPLKKDEIEDVLSSIRRLVSEDVRALAEPAAVATPQKPAPEAADKLVLTPSLRVGEDASTSNTHEPSAEDSSTEDLVAQEIAKSLAATEEDAGPRVLTLSKTGAETPAPTEGATVSPEMFKSATAEVDVAPEAEEVTTPKAEEETPETTVEDAQELPAVEWQSVRSYSEMEFEPEAAGESDYAGTEVDAIEWAQGAEAASGSHAAAQSEPDTPASEAVIEAEVVSQPKADDAPYEAVLDEEMLRDLVGEIVRQELQGPLGERITRNVRKLVRREINRALASRQID